MSQQGKQQIITRKAGTRGAAGWLDHTTPATHRHMHPKAPTPSHLQSIPFQEGQEQLAPSRVASAGRQVAQ